MDKITFACDCARQTQLSTSPRHLVFVKMRLDERTVERPAFDTMLALLFPVQRCAINIERRSVDSMYSVFDRKAFGSVV
jgi:hypothetical protein